MLTVKLRLTAQLDAQHAGFATGLEPNILGVCQLNLRQLDNTLSPPGMSFRTSYR